ncbi:DNA-damage-inducible protein F [Pseudomonas aeruginosa]|uniref:MATE family efflux transporter n=9 Tax=Pseudomonas aeruginosa TaxID=287 RepID=UPI000659AA57|nr:MATE family efflux transporter [Pseudomonas aeruginosa]CRR75978.1 DNA-damage-inducible protein F [Pseudomonas aeruginosa]
MMIEPSLASKLEAPCLLSVVVPVFNEEAVLPAFHQRLGAVLGDLGDDCEVLYVDDGSTDRSATILAQLQAADRRVGVARFTRNFGKEQAMSAGLKLSRGAAVIVIDADLQDPPELIPQMLDAWIGGAEMVNMRRRSRAGESWLKRASASAFYHTRLLGLPAALASYALVGWFLGTQNARAPLAILLTTNLSNIALVLWFVHGLDWGVQGAARASVLAEWSGALLGLALTRRDLARRPGRAQWQRLRHWLSWLPLLMVNRDIFIRSLALQLVFFLLTVQGTRLGDATVAANALLLNGLLLTSYALDGLAHAVEALCGHAIGARDRAALRRALVVAGGWSLLASLAFAALFALFGHLFIDLQSDIAGVREVAYAYLPYLACLPLLGMWSYLLDGLFIGATRAREMRNAMLVAVAASLPLGWLLQGLGNHGLWLAFLAFMLLRGLVLAAYGWRLTRRDGWFAAQGADSGR